MSEVNPSLRLSQLFADALELPPEERGDFLDRACEGDPGLRAEVESLLSTHGRVHAFLSEPALEMEAGAAPVDGCARADGSGDRCEVEGSIVGAYQLVKKIGEGGFGTVYMAEQLRPVQRTVAMKILKPGMDSRTVLARFALEQKALALMDHPNIARVLDAGHTAGGRPFVVMELVRGEPITEYCRANRLTIRERLGLFQSVCHAVQHAHQKGVIHRDLKPSNVLVTRYEGSAQAKVIDFGIAKAVGETIVEQTIFTPASAVVGTVQYLSPEQAAFTSTDVDTRSDVYSLGVLLYELLVGSPPLTRERAKTSPLDELLRTIREEDTPSPLKRLAELNEQATAAVSLERSTSFPGLRGMLRGELEWIVLRAVEKDRMRRYQTAQQLAEDIGRYLANEPINAAPVGWGYRARKFMRRHRTASIIGGLLAASLVVGASGTSWGFWQARRSLYRERDARARAEVSEVQAKAAAQRELEARRLEAGRRQEAEAVAHLLESLFEQMNPLAMAPRTTDFRVRMIQQTEAAAAGIKADRSIEPVRRARLRDALARTELGLGRGAKAESLLRLALTDLGTLAENAPEKLATRNSLGQVLIQQGRFKEAIETLADVSDARTLVLGADDPDTLRTQCNLGLAYVGSGRFEDGVTTLVGVEKAMRRVLGPLSPELLVVWDNLGMAFQAAGQYNRAIEHFQSVRRWLAVTVGDDHPLASTVLSNLVMAYAGAGRISEVVDLAEKVRKDRLKSFGPNHPDTYAAISHVGLAYYGLGKREEALELFAAAAKGLEETIGPLHPWTLTAKCNQGLALQDAARLEESRQLLEQVWKDQSKTLGASHPDTLTAVNNLALTLMYAGRKEEAAALLGPLMAPATAALGASHPIALMLQSNYAEILRISGRVAEAVPMFERVRDEQAKTLGADHPQTLQTLGNLSGAYARLGATRRAIEGLEYVRKTRVATQGAEHPDTLATISMLADAYRRAGNGAKAVELAEEAAAGSARRLSPAHAVARNILLVLAQSYEVAGKPDLAVQTYEKLRDIVTNAYGDHPETFNIQFLLAVAYADAGRAEDAMAMFERNYRDASRVLGEASTQAVSAAQNLAMDYITAKRTADAMELLERSRDAQLAAGEGDRVDIGQTFYLLSGIYARQDRNAECIQLLERARELQLAKLGVKNTKTLRTITSLGRAHARDGRVNEGIALVEQARTTYAEVVGAEHVSTLETTMCLAELYEKARRYADAEALLRAVGEIQARLGGPSSEDLRYSRGLLAQVLESSGRTAEAQEVRTKMHKDSTQDSNAANEAGEGPPGDRR